MPVKFTKHALEMLKARGLSETLVMDVLADPDDDLKAKDGNLISQKMVGEYLIRLERKGDQRRPA